MLCNYDKKFRCQLKNIQGDIWAFNILGKGYASKRALKTLIYLKIASLLIRND